MKFGLSINKKLKKGKYWGADAFKLGENLMDYAGKKIRIVAPKRYERSDAGDLYAVFDFFARFDTVYVCLYKDIPITTILTHK